MKLSPTFFMYIGRQYLMAFCAIMILMVGIIFIFDLIELLRRAADETVPFLKILQMGILKTPEVGQKLMPFAILFSAIFTFWRLTKNNELIIARAAGFSVWHFLGPVLTIALLLGVLKITAINPLSAVLLSKFEHMESRYLNNNSEMVELLDTGLWLRQANSKQGKHVILNAKSINPRDWSLSNIEIYFLKESDVLKRIDAPFGRLGKGYWIFENVLHHDFENPPKFQKQFLLPTPVTARDIEDSFASPETISFWELSRFIGSLEQLGFQTTSLKIYKQALIAAPLLFVSMVLLAASVSLRPPRVSRIFLLISSGVIAGFFVFILDNFLQAYGLSETIPPFMAAWSAPLLTFVISLTAMLYMEEGR